MGKSGERSRLVIGQRVVRVVRQQDQVNVRAGDDGLGDLDPLVHQPVVRTRRGGGVRPMGGIKPVHVARLDIAEEVGII